MNINKYQLSYTAKQISDIFDSSYITPQMFGAAGDGIQDDTVYIQKAFNECKTGIVYFPPGRYKTTSKLVCQNPITIKMCRQYPCDYQKDHPYDDSENWMGARIETYSPDIGITIGDGVCLDGFSIRAMPGFGGGIVDLSIIKQEQHKEAFIKTIDDNIKVFKYSTVIDLNEGDKGYDSQYKYLKEHLDEFTTGATFGKGIVLQYDGTLGTATYPSQVRFSHVRVDIAPLLQNGTESIVPENVYIIPECLFEFRPVESHNYIFEDIFLGQRHNRYCDNAFRTIIEQDYYRTLLPGETGTYIWDTNNKQYRVITEGETGTHTLVKISDPWCNNVYIKNMCIEARCDYAINIINNFSKKLQPSIGHTAYGWVFEELNIQAFDYIYKDYTGPIDVPKDSSARDRYNNPLQRTCHKSLIKINGMEDLTFIGCCLHDVVQHEVEQGFSEGIFNIDGQAIHRITKETVFVKDEEGKDIVEDKMTITPQEYYDKTLGNDYDYDGKCDDIIQNIACVGCSQEFDHIETYLSSKLEENRKNIDITNLSLNVEGQELILQDKNNTIKTTTLPTITINEDIINTAVSAWMEKATTPTITTGRNVIDENNNFPLTNKPKDSEYPAGTPNPFGNYNVNDQISLWGDNKLHFSGESDSSNGNYQKMWTTHYIPVKEGDVIRITSFSIDGQGNLSFATKRAAYYLLCYKKSDIKDTTNLDPYLPKTSDDFIKEEDVHGTYEIQINDSDIAYIRLVFMPYNWNNTVQSRFQALYPGDAEWMMWPQGVASINEKLLITINDENQSYEEYGAIVSTALTLLPTVTEVDNGKILQVVDGKWTAVEANI